MGKWRPPDASTNEAWRVVHQVVVPPSYRAEVLKTAHDLPMAGHLGIRKTQDRILQHFFWPRLHRDVAEFCKTCHTCQVVGKPNQKIKPASLISIPVLGRTV